MKFDGVWAQKLDIWKFIFSKICYLNKNVIFLHIFQSILRHDRVRALLIPWVVLFISWQKINFCNSCKSWFSKNCNFHCKNFSSLSVWGSFWHPKHEARFLWSAMLLLETCCHHKQIWEWAVVVLWPLGWQTAGHCAVAATHPPGWL